MVAELEPTCLCQKLSGVVGQARCLTYGLLEDVLKVIETTFT